MSLPASVQRGFTLLELLVVIAIMAMATAGVSMAMRDTGQTSLEREAQRLAVLFESARAQSRASGVPVFWRTTPEGFRFEGLPPDALPTNWLAEGISARTDTQASSVQLGPEPIIGPQSVELMTVASASGAALSSLFVSTDGLKPFVVHAAGQQ